MVCDFCAQSIEKVFMIKEMKKLVSRSQFHQKIFPISSLVNLEDQKIVIYLDEKTNIEDNTISSIFEDAIFVYGYLENNEKNVFRRRI